MACKSISKEKLNERPRICSMIGKLRYWLMNEANLTYNVSIRYKKCIFTLSNTISDLVTEYFGNGGFVVC